MIEIKLTFPSLDEMNKFFNGRDTAAARVGAAGVGDTGVVQEPAGVEVKEPAAKKPAPAARKASKSTSQRDAQQSLQLQAKKMKDPTPAADATTSVAETAPASAGPSATSPVAEQYSRSDVDKALRAFVALRGMDGGRKLLGKLGIMRLSDLPAARYAEFMSAIATV